VLVLLYTAAFSLMHSLPGGPWDSTKPVPPAVRKNLERYYHLDEPFWRQYVRYIRNLFRGDLGPSYVQTYRDVDEILGPAVAISLSLGVPAVFFSIAIGILAGAAMASSLGKAVDQVLSLLFNTCIGIPEYVSGPLLLLITAVAAPALPATGWAGILSRGAILPILTLLIRPIAIIARYSRSSLMDVLEKDYIVTAYAKGAGRMRVLAKHALRNALQPIMTVGGTLVAFVITGTFYVEVVYGIPGFGRVFVNSVVSRDYPVALAAILVVGAFMCVINLCVDALYVIVDPRVTYD